MNYKEALQKTLKAIDLLITADNMSSFETSILTDDMRKEVMEYQISAQQSLEQSEPRMFSEEEVIGFGIWLGEKYWFNLSTYKWECRNEEGLYEVLDSKRLIELYIQSLSPKKGKEESFEDKVIKESVQIFEQGGFNVIPEPNQTEALSEKNIIFQSGVSLGRTKVIEEIEGFANKNKHSIWNSKDSEYVYLSSLINFLNNLKK